MRTTTSILRFQSPLRCPVRFRCDHAVLFQWIIPGFPRSPLDFSKHTATVGHGSLFHYRRQKERTGAIKKTLIRLTIFPLMQYVYANGMRRTTQQKPVQCAGICWMQEGRYRQRAHRAKYLFSSARGCPCRTVSPADLPKSMPLWLSANAHISALSDSVSWFSYRNNTYSGKYAFSVGSAASCCAWSTKALKVSGAICRR